MDQLPLLPPEPRDIGRHGFALGLLLITAVAAGLRFDGLTLRDLWLDENCTFHWVHHMFNWPAEGADPWKEPAHLPYLFLLHLWTRVAGEAALGLRSFSAIFGCIGVIAVGLLAGYVGGRRVGLIAALLAAVHPLHVYYSQEARCYAFWSADITLCLWALCAAARTDRTRWWLTYGILAWVAVLTHYYVLLLLPGTVSVVLLAHDRKRCLRRWLQTHLALGAALLPVAWFLILPYLDTGAKGWKRAMWLGYPPALAIPKSLWALLPSGGYPAEYLGTLSAAAGAAEERLGVPVASLARWMPAAMLAILFCTLLVATVRGVWQRSSAFPGISPRAAGFSPRGFPVQTGTSLPLDVAHENGSYSNAAARPMSRAGWRAALFFLSLSLVFLLLAVCQAWLWGQGFIVGRYDLAIWPSLTIAIALTIGEMGTCCAGPAQPVCSAEPGAPRRGSVLVTALVAVLVSCSAITLIGLRSLPVHHETRQRAAGIAAVVGPEDLVISVGLYRWFLEYEWHQVGFSSRVLSFPPAHDGQFCWEDAEVELADPDQIAADVKYVTSRIERAIGRSAQVWLLAQGKTHGPRWEVDKRFFAALRERRIEVELVDDSLGLARLTRPPADPQEPAPSTKTDD